ncbi:CaiB/BaiF CoA transferase family protein [Paracraurococcus lichenis]|uniref:CaiB/BaiF CoA-transferase family protein n=1 Tax=Paracraurococcus lichenis TaxID=3064888 RepID=A0ABT9E0U8_9PROT|nr:CaiB/BaiF CoA-transferase family protein [Paracraurococcus sp. LOR1-02]MDO9709769.1 CaiB/BaiF CoA-transferase family protein [Paracraurococcus sp. LOR1-02]
MTDALPTTEGKGLARSAGALAGLRVIDLTRVLGGPYCTMVLSDHGAEVIKLEPPQGDEVRDWGPPFDEAGDASYFVGVNRNKRSVGLDLSKPEGKEVLLRLLEGADVLVENFKPGSMEKWGLGYEQVLKARFPRLVHCRVSGFGATGPLGGFPGYDAVLQAMTGLMSINGTGDSGPTRLGNPIVDIATGLFSAIGILMALQEREKSGLGQYVDMTLHDCGMALLHPHAANYFLSGKRPKATGNPHPNLAPYSKFRTRTCEIFVAAGNDPAFRKFCDFLGMPEVAQDPRFATNGARVTNRDALTALLEARFAEEDGHDLTRRMLAAGLPAGPVLHVDEAMAAEHTAHRAMVTELGGYRGLGTPIKLSRTPGGTRAAPPRFAEHTEEVLASRGFSAEELKALRASGVLVEQRRK